MNTLQIGTKVKRLAAQTDYTNGRTGEVVEIDAEANRYRVLWTGEPTTRLDLFPNGIRPLKVRTWVRREFLEAL